VLLEDVVRADVVLDVELLEVVGAAVVVVELLDVGAGVVVELELVAASLVDPYRYVSLASQCESSNISLPFTSVAAAVVYPYRYVILCLCIKQHLSTLHISRATG
jgi:hypothetical protein